MYTYIFLPHLFCSLLSYPALLYTSFPSFLPSNFISFFHLSPSPLSSFLPLSSSSLTPIPFCLSLVPYSPPSPLPPSLPPLQVFIQLIKQTAGVPLEEIDTPGVLSCWQTLACMCCTFIPEREIKRYLTMHIKK